MSSTPSSLKVAAANSLARLLIESDWYDLVCRLLAIILADEVKQWVK